MWEAQCGEGPVEESAQGRGLHEGPLLYQTATSVTCSLALWSLCVSLKFRCEPNPAGGQGNSSLPFSAV